MEEVQQIKRDLLLEKECKKDENGQYNFCPYCLKDFRRNNKGKAISYKDCLPALKFRKYYCVEIVDGKQNKYCEEVFFCENCNRELTDIDFLNAYCLVTKGRKYNLVR